MASAPAKPTNKYDENVVPDYLMPRFSVEAVNYIIQTKIPRHNETLCSGDEQPVLLIKPNKGGGLEDKLPEAKLDDVLPKPPSSGKKRKAGDGEADDENLERYSQTFSCNGSYCPHLGGVHKDPACPMKVELRYWCPAGKEVKFGDQLPTTVSLRCMSETCKDLHTTLDMPLEAEHYAAHKAEFEKTTFKVRHPFAFGVVWDEGVDLVNKMALHAMEENAPTFFGGATFTGLWTRDPAALTYRKVDLFPPACVEKVPADVYNMWRGYAASRIKANDEPVDVGPFITLMADVFAKEGNYVTKYCAHIIQKPGQKTGIALTVIGMEGVGKGTVFENTMALIMGDAYCAYTSNPHDLVARHSEMKNGKILVLCDDFKRERMHKIANETKSLITAKKQPYEKKHVQAVMLTNYANYVNLTNDDDPIDFSGEARRHVVVVASDKLMDNLAYFVAYNSWIDKPENQRAVYDYLMAYDLSGFNPTRDKPVTECGKKLKLLHQDPVFYFLYEKLHEDWAELERRLALEDWEHAQHARKKASGQQLLFVTEENWGGKYATQAQATQLPKGEFAMSIIATFIKEGSVNVNGDELHDDYATKWWPRMKYEATKMPLDRTNFGTFLYNKLGRDVGCFSNTKTNGKRNKTYTFNVSKLAAILAAKGFNVDLDVALDERGDVAPEGEAAKAGGEEAGKDAGGADAVGDAQGEEMALAT